MVGEKRPISEVDGLKPRLGKESNLKALEPKILLNGPDDWRHPKRWKMNADASTSNAGSSEESDAEDDLLLNKLAPLSFYLDKSSYVCFGMIHNVTAKVLDVEDFSRVSLDGVCSIPNLAQLHLSFKSNAVYAGSSESEPMAVLNEEIAKVLHDLSTMNSCRFETYLATNTTNKISLPKDAKSQKTQFLELNIVLYGSDAVRNSVSTLLSRARLYLQHPCFKDPDTEYDNPHVLDLTKLFAESGVSTVEKVGAKVPAVIHSDSSIHSSGDQDGVSANEELRNKLSRVFNSLTRYKSLTRLEADIKVTTPLLPHQEEALDFMVQRELGPVPSEYSLWSKCKRDSENIYENVITGSRTDAMPNETFGGILADDMGLGKTLTVISTIIRTANLASQFHEKGQYSATDLDEKQMAGRMFNSRATLVVVPSPLLIDGWQKEIEAHCDGSLNVNVYHGRGREVSPDALANWDIVLSTYHTIAAEVLDEDSPLYKINWFRIVLDEAHIIRRMSTKLFQSMAKLTGNFRWCLTGTPIQNSLEDLASLVAFIKCPSLESLQDFRKHIVSPLLKGTDEGVQSLRILLDSICLRRTKKLLNLPDVIDEDHYIEFSSAEKAYYDETQAEMVATVKRQDSHARNSKDYFGIFQLQLQLRRLCNHGTLQKKMPRAVAEDIQIDPDQALDYLRQKRKASCAYCKSRIQRLDGNEGGDKPGKGDGMFTVCGHLLCSGCVPTFESAVWQGSDANVCPLCSKQLPKDIFARGETSCLFSTRGSTTMPQYDESGTSAKVSQLLRDVKDNKSGGKSIVFSSWTKSLDLVGHYLTHDKLKFLRIDGTFTLSQRQNILYEYENNSEVRILLMTTGTGAVGLNLTIASCVYILEPQWNPMIESQAIARVLRIGQERDVQVVRYIVTGTVEEMMRSQQLRKLGFARMGWRQDE